MLRLLNRDEQRKPGLYELLFTEKSSVMNWSFVFLAQREDPEVSSELLELSIDRTVTKTRSEIFTNVKMGKSAPRKMRGRQPLWRYLYRPCSGNPRQSSETAMFFMARTVEWFIAQKKIARSS
jgi:hypothetical protein